MSNGWMRSCGELPLLRAHLHFSSISRATEGYEQALEERHANSSDIGDLGIEISESGRKNGSESLKRDGLDQTGKIGEA